MSIVAPLPPDHAAICEAEPITRPGAVQPFGFLLAVEEETGRIAQASANAVAFVGREAHELVGRLLDEVLCAASCARIAAMMRTECYAPTNFTRVRTRDGARSFDALAHRSHDTLVVECLPIGPETDATRAVCDAQRLIQRLRDAPDFETMLGIAAREARDLTGFDRAMVYRFDEDGHGAVVAESRREDLEPYLGLHYPASDIPAQARRMYLLQRVRQIPDVDAATAALVGAPGHDPAGLDMTHAVLRAVSPYHLEYLRNMGVKATFAVSLIVGDALWGMLVFHHGRRRDVDCTLRGLCDLVGQTLSALLDLRADADREAALAARADALRAIERELAEADTVSAGLGAVADRLLEVMGAGGCWVRIGGTGLRFGHTPPEAACRTILARLGDGAAGYAAHAELRVLDPALAAHAGCAAGAAAIVLPARPGEGIVWFRPERLRTVSWGGDPSRPVDVDPTSGRLGPRRSFAAFVEQVAGTSGRFDEADAEVAQRLRRAVLGALLRISEERLHRVRTFDPLTGLLRREVAEPRLRRMAAAADREVVGVLVVRVARLSGLVERWGVEAGETAILEAARRLQELVRRGEVLARWGDDGFLLGVRRDGVEALRRLGAEVLDAFRTPLTVGGTEVALTVHAGVAVHPGVDLGSLVATAADAAGKAAEDRRGRFVLLERPPERAAPSPARLELEIAPALARGEFRVVLEPIVALADGRPIGVEAHPRWPSPAFGEVDPALFLPAAVESGQAFALAAALLDAALRHAGPEIAAGRLERLAVRFDAGLLARRGLAAMVLSALDRARVPPGALVLEIGGDGRDLEGNAAALARLREGGVRIALADLADARVSLAALARLPIDCVRIGSAFLDDAGAEGRGDAVLAAMVALARALGCDVVAVGLADAGARERARAAGCDKGQGAAIAPALEGRALAGWLAAAPRSGA
ncbi:bifunctional diguanylate cyclase/phosphodiesterase [Salinarimonas chemoclinalis]|uniref:bifunctional diguanylate cyclase/phosphodiesterase n=1 Tax=Salinarimonas chemoclinalis TaxID=3241599 RepID=UPI0035564BF6